ncbi:YbaK/EbsC family protein [Aliiroseovarius sp. Z3]|uniref:YbaK/EbsC family protein n=1 Tax=Aliiroseovarius sp. Z3 TaxID=2811402 RepID=UPI0023B32026|nr:YbaK/EbsC family protein [Aliiroseovarius sp. Z3]MDE9449163.1 YbaK/EbsC family protein [Aliiroseovarius sp. Z3]
MSKSLKRVKQALVDLGIDTEVREMSEGTRTAADAARAVGCNLDQIAKSIIFRGEESGHVILFLTAGGNQVDAGKASALAGEPLGKADAKLIRAETGFAIGGVSPVGLIQNVRAFYDPRLLAFETVWAAAGTPRHVFPAPPSALIRAASAVEGDFIEDAP